MTIADIEQIFLEQMPAYYDQDEIKSICSLATLHVCGYSKSYYLLHKNTDLTLTQETGLIRILDELRSGRPLQHVLGEADFYGLRFKVNSAVLVPRPETEELVDWVIKSVEKGDASFANILDIGTGSGCIPISLKKNIPASQVFALDISRDALKVARQNCLLNDVTVNLIQADILDEDFIIHDTRFDIIVSNPPYVTYSEKDEMHKNVLQYDPHEALFVPDTNPLVFYEAIAHFGLRSLTENGVLFFEINENLGAETSALLNAKGFRTELRKDMQGKDRMIKAFR